MTLAEKEARRNSDNLRRQIQAMEAAMASGSMYWSTQRSSTESDSEEVEGVGSAEEEVEDNVGGDSSKWSSGASDFDCEAESSVANTSHQR